MKWTRLGRIVVLLSALTTVSVPAFSQVELTGSYAIRMYEDYIERGPGSYMGDFTGMPMSDEGRAKALLLHLEPSLHDRAPVPRAVTLGGTVPAARPADLERGR